MSILEQLIDNDYQCALLDLEGDFEGFQRAVTFGVANQAPDRAGPLMRLRILIAT